MFRSILTTDSSQITDPHLFLAEEQPFAIVGLR